MLMVGDRHMLQICYYSPAERDREKERQRASDEAQWREGKVSQADLGARNGFLSSLQIIASSISCREVFD